MNRPREHFLAGAGFAGDEDRDVGGRDAPGDVEERLHFLGQEEGAAWFLDGLRGPECGAIAFVAPGLFEGQGGLPDAHDVAEQDRRGRGRRGRAHQCQPAAANLAQVQVLAVRWLRIGEATFDNFRIR